MMGLLRERVSCLDFVVVVVVVAAARTKRVMAGERWMNCSTTGT
jgi:hypothetical protein